MDASEDIWERRATLRYRLCPRCFRAVPANSSERYCINDGSWLLERCPLCSAAITNPYARYCAACGLEFAGVSTTVQGASVEDSLGTPEAARNTTNEQVGMRAYPVRPTRRTRRNQ